MRDSRAEMPSAWVKETVEPGVWQKKKGSYGRVADHTEVIHLCATR
jgi:hypothetical protein